jgi:hypothetical protein
MKTTRLRPSAFGATQPNSADLSCEGPRPLVDNGGVSGLGTASDVCMELYHRWFKEAFAAASCRDLRYRLELSFGQWTGAGSVKR